MDFLRQNKTLWTAIGVIVLVFAGYVGFFRDTSAPTALTSETVVSGAGAGSDLVVLLNELRSLELDPALFSNNAFRSLQDFSVELVSEEKGRNNPFAPLGADGTFTDGETDDEDPGLLDDLEEELEGLDL